MANLTIKINEDFKTAMRERDQKTLSTLRMLISALKNKEISLREGKEVEMTDEKVIEVIRSEVKKRNEAVSIYKEGGRLDLAQKEKEEIKILEKYLPPEMSEEEMEKEIKEIIDKESIKDFGKLMGAAMQKLKGRADGNRVSEVVKKILAK